MPTLWDQLADALWDKLVSILASHQLEPSQLQYDEFNRIFDLLFDGEEIDEVLVEVKQRIR
jgi:DNA-binding sugar fermentation-stimulating protein